MPSVKSKSVLAKYGNKFDKDVQQHASDPIKWGFTRLPPGILNGRAQLIECRFDVFKTGNNVGEAYLYAKGVVVEPRSVIHNGQLVPIEGSFTSIILPVCQTTNSKGKVTSAGENIAAIENEFKKFGVEIDPNETLMGLETIAHELEDSQPYFKFSTTSSPSLVPGGEPRTWENWLGVMGLEDYVPPEDSGVTDNSTAPSRNGSAAVAETSPDSSEASPDSLDLDSTIDDLVDRSENGEDEEKETAQVALTEMAVAAGISEDDISAAKSWKILGGMIKEAQSQPPPDDASPDSLVPEKGQVFHVFLSDPKTKKKAKKPTEVEVTLVDPKKETVSIKDVSNPRAIYRGIGWSELTPIPD